MSAAPPAIGTFTGVVSFWDRGRPASYLQSPATIVKMHNAMLTRHPLCTQGECVSGASGFQAPAVPSAAPSVRFVAYTMSRLLADRSDDENASVMHLGSGAFTIGVKRVGDCSL
jgi:hypothetical protein